VQDYDPFEEASPLPEYPESESDPTEPKAQVSPRSPVTLAPAEPMITDNDDRIAAIKSTILSQSKWVSSCLNSVAEWRFENGEVRLCYAKEHAGVADILKGREPAAKLRAACEQVLGRPVKICVTLQEGEGALPVQRRSVRERAASDPTVEAFRRRFDCTLVDFQDLSGSER